MTPEQRIMRARLGAHTLHAQGKTNTAAARAASPQSIGYWAKQVDPGGELSEAERTRRAEHARRAHMQRLALASSRARARRRRGAA